MKSKLNKQLVISLIAGLVLAAIHTAILAKFINMPMYDLMPQGQKIGSVIICFLSTGAVYTFGASSAITIVKEYRDSQPNNRIF